MTRLSIFLLGPFLLVLLLSRPLRTVQFTFTTGSSTCSSTCSSTMRITTGGNPISITNSPTKLFASRRGKLSKELADITSSETIPTKAVVAASASSSRREKSKERQRQSAAVFKQEKLIIDSILEIVAAPKRDLPSLNAAVSSLTTLPSNPFKVLTSSSSPLIYTVAFAYDDTSLSHVGTGLHNVPLARLDAMYLTLKANTVTIQEVIRIIGPFPNVLNTLSGRTTVEGDDVMFTINSVIDGTGKELVGEEDRIVTCNIVYGSENVVVMETGEKGEGKYLIFVKEEDLDGQLYEKNLGEEKKNKI
ncbi:hypothetical protein TrVE_jg11619 [Triparma verrucosa]|uniref:Plastid lipid-associated protein/fibrillin conserved domain-containing protein n=1 Tax=Triparma verrucosa TaxID=1606542 RepID=A0A9W7B2L7_9STRA|nr:hypothetical protein TrVE_jg11619 [Triparma verrucosa]